MWTVKRPLTEITLGRKTYTESQNHNIYFVLLHITLLKHSYYSNIALQELTIYNSQH